MCYPLACVCADVLSSGMCELMCYPLAHVCDNVLVQPYGDISYPVKGTRECSVE